jgi:hypothetical protein
MMPKLLVRRADKHRLSGQANPIPELSHRWRKLFISQEGENVAQDNPEIPSGRTLMKTNLGAAVLYLANYYI